PSKAYAFYPRSHVRQLLLRFRADSSTGQFAFIIRSLLSGNVECVAGNYSITEGQRFRSRKLNHALLLGDRCARTREQNSKSYNESRCEHPLSLSYHLNPAPFMQ